MTTPNLGMPELTSNNATQYLTVNTALSIIDAVLQAPVIDKDLATPPGSPADGALYIVAGSPTGAWSGQTGKLALYRSSTAAWTFITAKNGYKFWVTDESTYYRYNGSSWVIDVAITGETAINSQSGTSYTLVLGDAQYCVEMNNAAANTLTVPPNASVAFPTGTTIIVRQMGAGQTEIVAGSGVTIRAPESLYIRKQYGQAVLHKRDTNEWCLEGNLETV